MSELIKKLASTYAGLEIDFPNLKAVTLAQWILESGRGTSELARLHYNFGGLKWRSEMTTFATKVYYEAHDGPDYYCKFDSLEAFLVGYWKFMSRTPYKGWEEHAATGEAYIRFIGPTYTPSPTYADKVLALVKEAEELLSAAPDPGAKPLPSGPVQVIVIDPGHGGTVKIEGSSPNNAVAPNGELEKDWVLDLAFRTEAKLLSLALERGVPVKVVLTRRADHNLGLSVRADVANKNDASLFLSIHFNASDKHNARGLETLIDAKNNLNSGADAAFAQNIQDELLLAWKKIDPRASAGKFFDRKVKKQELGVLRDASLKNQARVQKIRACLVEVEFMDVDAVVKLLTLRNPTAQQTANRERLALALAEGLLKSLK